MSELKASKELLFKEVSRKYVLLQVLIETEEDYPLDIYIYFEKEQNSDKNSKKY